MTLEPTDRDRDREAEAGRRRDRRLATRPRVLLIDDDPEFLSVFRELLEEEGYTVDTATRGSTALDKASSRPPDVIVCDLCLPGGDGFEVIDRLRAGEATHDIPIFAITGISALEDEDTAQAALHAGFAGIFHKPVDWATMRELLGALLR